MALEKFFVGAEREPSLYSQWESAGLFEPSRAAGSNKAPFNISMPPPNANGELHLGHAFGYTVMDILGRFFRLQGHPVLLLPGKDHAGIQTQVVYEKKLKAEGVDITKKSTEELYASCYEFCKDRAHYMQAQEKTLGLSADWSKELFTLDPRLNKIVFETFEKMWKDGLIYKGTRIVNWSVFSQTSISDVEVEYKEQDGGLWYIAYQLETPYKSSSELTLPSGKKITVGEHGIVTATTRPETMLGDTGLAVHPEDPRYKDLIGKFAIVPLVNRRIPIVGDSRIDPAYGTGVVKVTPAHDFTDYDIGQDHKLPAVQVIGKDGKMTAEAGEAFVGLTAAKCREAVIQTLTDKGLLLDTATMKHKVPIGERGKDIIEPLISEQWFVNVDKPGNSLKQRALALVKEGKIKIHPARFQVLFEQWLENLRDWNISRQLWWGHRLPVWYKGQETYVGTEPPSGPGWTQEKDIFDTWFSSGQWAFSTMAAHGLTDLNKNNGESPYFPTHTMVMGRDILFFWACRMLLLTVYRTGGVPWKNIFFTGLIRDEHGQKMSKSKGNGIDPNDIIKKYGADSLRLALVMGATPGNDLALGERKIEGYSKFINKLWNAAKLLELKLEAVPSPASPVTPTLTTSKWLFNELGKVKKNVSQKLSEYEISIAADELYNFTWSVFCDWYLEMMKILVDKSDEATKQEVKSVTVTVFQELLTMLHPFTPFLTEEIFQKLSFVKDVPFLAQRAWERPLPEGTTSSEIGLLMELSNSIRSVKAVLGIPHKRINAAISIALSDEMKLLLGELAKVDFVSASAIPAHLALTKPFSAGNVICEVEGKEQYRIKLEKDLTSNSEIVAHCEKKLSGSFAQQAKPEVVEKEREKLAVAKRAVEELTRELGMFQK